MEGEAPAEPSSKKIIQSARREPRPPNFLNNQIQRGGILFFFLFLTLCVGIAAVLSPWIYMGIQSWAQSTDNSWIHYLSRHPFHRYFNRVLQVSLLLGMGFIFRRTGFFSWQALGLRSSSGERDFAFGFLCSTALLALYAIALLSMGIYDVERSFYFTTTLPVLGVCFMTGLTVSVLEEIFFRGFLYRLCLKEWGVRLALIFNGLFFSTVHFLKPDTHAISDVNAFSGVKMITLAFSQFNSTQFIPYFLLLFFMALILCWTVDKTGNLWLAIGLHAGLVFGVMFFGEMKPHYRSSLPQWVFGGGDLKSGIFALLPLGLMFVGIKLWFKKMSRGQKSS